MKKILGVLATFFLFLTFNTNYIYAQSGHGNNCSDFDIGMSNISGGPFNEEQPNTISFTTSNIANHEIYTFIFLGETNSGPGKRVEIDGTVENGKINFSTSDARIFEAGDWTVKMAGLGIVNPPTMDCTLGKYEVIGPRCTDVYVAQIDRDDSSAAGVCFYDPDGGCLDIEHDVYVHSTVVNSDGSPYTGNIRHELKGPSTGTKYGSKPDGTLFSNFGELRNGTYSVAIKQGNATLCSYGFHISLSCSEEEDMCQEIKPDFEAITLGPDKFSLCKQIPKEQVEQRNACLLCTEGTEENEGNAGVWTAIGCIKRDPTAIVEKLVTVGLSIGGGFALITFLTAGFIYSTSQGNPEKVKNAKEMMTASIVGIIFVIFSVTMLQFIGWSILKIPGFGG